MDDVSSNQIKKAWQKNYGNKQKPTNRYKNVR